MNRAHYLKTDIRRPIKITQYIWPLWVLQVSMWFPLKIMRLLRGMVNGNALDTYGFAVSMSGL